MYVFDEEENQWQDAREISTTSQFILMLNKLKAGQFGLEACIKKVKAGQDSLRLVTKK